MSDCNRRRKSVLMVRTIFAVAGLMAITLRAVSSVLARSALTTIAVAGPFFTTFDCCIALCIGLGYSWSCVIRIDVTVSLCKTQRCLVRARRLAIFVTAWAALRAASTTATTSTSFTSILTGFIATVLGGSGYICCSCVVTRFGRALGVLVAFGVARWSVAAVTPVRAFATGRTFGARFVTATVMSASGLQTHVIDGWLYFPIKTLATALTLTLSWALGLTLRTSATSATSAAATASSFTATFGIAFRARATGLASSGGATFCVTVTATLRIALTVARALTATPVSVTRRGYGWGFNGLSRLCGLPPKQCFDPAKEARAGSNGCRYFFRLNSHRHHRLDCLGFGCCNGGRCIRQYTLDDRSLLVGRFL